MVLHWTKKMRVDTFFVFMAAAAIDENVIKSLRPILKKTQNVFLGFLERYL